MTASDATDSLGALHNIQYVCHITLLKFQAAQLGEGLSQASGEPKAQVSEGRIVLGKKISALEPSTICY